ncbi:OsmC family protein [Neomegalonema perideroedes]|uniref:OsmC family protein n=1 Tax=Neomegalonema perideroedes TaxID=217219 RepID=UPI00037B4C2B|nr:OsmC family protein [Neomegalonema perideroedes]
MAEVYESRFHDMSFRAVARDSGEVKVFTDKTSFAVGSAISFDNESAEISSVDYFAGALLSSLMLTLRAHGRRRGVPVEDLEGSLSLQLADPLPLVGVRGAGGTPHFSRIRARIYAYTGLTPEAFGDFCQEALRLCPVYQTLARSADVAVLFKPLD